MQKSQKRRSSMYYSDEEIQGMYRLAKDPEAQIQVLAELNLCSTKEICEILGIEHSPPSYTAKEERAILAEYNKGTSPKALAKKLGLHVNIVQSVLRQRKRTESRYLPSR